MCLIVMVVAMPMSVMKDWFEATIKDETRSKTVLVFIILVSS